MLQRKEIILIKTKVKNSETLSYMNWITLKNYFGYNRNLSDEKALLKQILSLSRC